MKFIHVFPLFLFAGVPILWGQADKNETTPPVLPPLAVEASSAGDLTLDDALIIDASALVGRSLTSLDGISAIAPNLHLNGNGIKSFGDVVTLRGVGNTQFFGAPGVQVYVDGVPQGNVFSYGSALYDLESIEVLMGPQGHRFGKVSSGGVINLRTQRPGDAQKNKATVSFGSFSSQSYQLSSSGPLQDNLSYVLALRKAQSDGFLKNASGRDNDSESLNGRLSFFWDGGEGTKASFGVSFDDHELGAQPVVSRNQAGFYARSTDYDEFTEIDRDQQYLTIERELDGFRLISITNRNDWNMDPNRLDLDLNVAANTFFTATSLIEQEQKEWSQEIRLEAEEGSALDWTLGFFYADNEIEGKATRNLIFMGFEQITTYSLDSENHALFASVGKDLTDVDKLTVGLRYDKFEKGLQRTKTFTLPKAPQPEDFSSLSPSIEWTRKFSDQLEGVARFSYVEKPGGFSAFTDDDAQLKFSEEEMNAYEIGFHYKPSDTWGLNVTAYLNEIENYQFEMPVLGTTDYYVANADEVTAKGLEIEGYFVPAADWTLSAMYGLCDTEYDEFASLAALKGKQVSFVPDHTLSLSLSYADEDGVFGQLGSRTIGETHYWDNTGANSGDVIDTYTLLDARIGIQRQDWEISVFATNLTDEEYYTSLVSSLINPLDANLQKAPGVVGSPRVIGVSLSKDF
jgi:iron complex outermembrane recepter protein